MFALFSACVLYICRDDRVLINSALWRKKSLSAHFSFPGWPTCAFKNCMLIAGNPGFVATVGFN